MNTRGFFRTARTQRGTTLIEVVVTMFILAVGLLGMAALQSQAVKDEFDTGQRSQVMWLVNELVERMRANPAGWQDYINASAGDVCAAPNAICADHSNGAGAVAGSECSSSQMASFDVWEIFCGYNIDNTIANSVDSIVIEDVNITCAGACNPGEILNIDVDFTSKSVTDNNVVDGANPDQTVQEDETQTIRFSVRPSP